MEIRNAVRDDLAALTAIYNHYIRTSPATFDIEEFSAEQRVGWFGHYAPQGRHRLLVSCDADGDVIGYATSSPHRPKAAYETSIETTIYLTPESTGQGMGTTLYAALFDALEGEDVHRAYAGVTMPNDASVRLHERFGFVRAGYYTEQGRKFGRYWDVAWFEKKM